MRTYQSGIAIIALTACSLAIAQDTPQKAAEETRTTPKGLIFEDAQASPKVRTDNLLEHLRLDEKIRLTSGVDHKFIPEIERLGLPRIGMVDGPMGLTGRSEFGVGTCMPAALCLAATWNEALTEEFGRVQGNSCRAVGRHILLGPGVNLSRNPQLGRNAEYMGEDPFLAGKMAAGVVRGIQSRGVISCIKHFVANDLEYPRTQGDSQVDERTLRELYLLPFEMAVKEAAVGSVMGAYNHVNGVRSCLSDYLLKDVLRTEWGFDGFVMSDWGAGGSAPELSAPSGLDLAMPNGPMGDPDRVLPLVKAGKIDPAVYDQKVGNMYRKFFEFGFLDRPQKDERYELKGEVNAEAALQVAREGMVLLKNEKNLLPINSGTVKRIAVIGPHARKDHPAEPYVTGPSGSSSINPDAPLEILTAMQKTAPQGIEILAAPDPMEQLYATTRYMHRDPQGRLVPGLKATYFPVNDFSGSPALERVEADVNAHSRWRYKGWLQGTEMKDYLRTMSVRYEGLIIPEADGVYRFAKNCLPSVRVWLDGELLFDDVTALQKNRRPVPSRSVVRSLEANKEYSLKIEYAVHPDFLHWSGLRFGWAAADFALSEAVQTAAQADVAVVCVGYDYLTEGEGFERQWELPDAQAEFIRAVAAVNSNLVVVLTGGGSCETASWIDRAPALLHAWYLGENGAQAVTDILYGTVNPSGKLPVSFERALEDNPSTRWFHADWTKPQPYPVQYGEGIFMGYRGMDQAGTEPLFPFGHGLSYTTFEYGEFHLLPAEKGAVRVRGTVRNSGRRRGAEVVQLYVQDVESSLPRPPRELKGFARVELDPGESAPVEFLLDERSFSFYHPDQKQWVAEPGEFVLHVGASSRDIRRTLKHIHQ